MARPDTIFALASAPGRAGVAVVRVSGPAARDCIKTLIGNDIPEVRRAVLRTFRGSGGEAIDEGLVLWFEAPNSLTGEDVAEFQVHGGRAIVDAIATELAAVPGCRPAGPGEFTRRAVENGKLDLTQAEAIADLVNAETEAQRRQAFRQKEGVLGTLYEAWRAQLVRALAWAEAAIDFSEEDLPAILIDARDVANAVRDRIGAHLDDARRGELVREGLFLTVIGPPNAGKSSLVNALAGRDVAIVSETAGTTRDVIEVRMDLGGFAVILADTAGLRAAGEQVEAEGVRRALARAETADLVLLLLDGSVEETTYEIKKNIVNLPSLTVWNKADLPWPSQHEGLKLSLKTGEGLDALVEAIAAKAKERLEFRGDSPVLTRPRHRHALMEALEALERASSAPEPELFAEDLRLALRALGRITGRVDVEELLDTIFRDFCIGK
jgi:tRNA modification GTPase